MQLHFNLTHDSTQQIEPGYCQCGCGQKTPISNYTSEKDQTIKGQPVRYITGHHNRRPATERFWAKVDKRGPDECWEWQAASRGHGYGVFWDGERYTPAHRFSYTLEYGPIADGLDICHKCDNPPCCNPAHLFAGTRQENMEDCRKKGRVRNKAHIGIDNPKAKLTVDDVLRVRALAASGISASQIARMYGMDDSSIGDVIKRKSWKHVA